MMISIITPVLNRRHDIVPSLRSLHSQTYTNFEHIIQDGVSTDGTIEYLTKQNFANCEVYSEADTGIYDAINKGIEKSKGRIIGLLHAGDEFCQPDIIEQITEQFNLDNVDLCYGNVEFGNSCGQITRKWKSTKFEMDMMRFGWMPPHTSVFVKREIFEKYGMYNPSYEISGDYEWLLRVLKQSDINTKFIDNFLVRMLNGGKSMRFLSLGTKIREDFAALSEHGYNPYLGTFCKYARKLPQLKKSLLRS